MTIGNTQTITEADLITECNQSRAEVNTIRTTTADFQVDIQAIDATSSSDASVMTLIWTPQTNYELLALRLVTEGATAADVHTFTLSVNTPGGEYLLDTTPSVTVTATGTGREQAATGYTTTTGTRLNLVRGVPLKLTLSTTSAGVDYLQGTLVLRTARRKL